MSFPVPRFISNLKTGTLDIGNPKLLSMRHSFLFSPLSLLSSPLSLFPPSLCPYLFGSLFKTILYSHNRRTIYIFFVLRASPPPQTHILCAFFVLFLRPPIYAKLCSWLGTTSCLFSSSFKKCRPHYCTKWACYHNILTDVFLF